MATTNGSTAIRDKILASLARYRALRIGKFPCAFWRLSSRPGLTATDSALGAEGYGLLIHVMNQCLLPNNNIQVCINDAIRSTIRFEGVKGTFSFDATGKAQRSLMINRVNAGQMEFIVQVY
ncbi:hypothetical protein BMR05_15515 [Methylococcaceae bacterium HT4]|nr:hypothetical protein BMR05_15515 [Methylococcaceae bacterium HT4]TXL18764.1 hypothetical protein BMR06_13340 [Methylococcaceae bacterium HT5]